MKEQLEAIEPGSFSGYLRYLHQGRRYFKLAFKHLVGRNFYNLLEFFSPANLLLFLKLKVQVCPLCWFLPDSPWDDLSGITVTTNHNIHGNS